MRLGVLAALWIGAALPAGLPAASGAAGLDLQPLNLRVDGGEETWHADRSFDLHWDNPAQPAGSEVAAVRYRVLGPSGQVVLAQTRIGWAARNVDRLRVPDWPGVYTAEVWLENVLGAEGAPVSAKLRFDDARPGRVDPLAPPGWIGRTSFPYLLRLGQPAGSDPISGIRGYAISIGPTPGGDPCASTESCSEAETDLRGGRGAGTLSISSLPEGASHVHAVAVSGSGIRSASVGQAILRVDTTDPVTRLSGLPRGWSNRPVTLTAAATDAAAGMAASGRGGPFTAIQIDGGRAATASGDAVTTTVIESGVHAVAHYARDAAGNVAGERSDEVWIDRDPPRLAFSNAQDPSDPERIEARLSDSLSGPDPGRGQIAIRRAGSAERFEALPTVTDGGALKARWSSEDYPRGEYEFRATGYDRAGNASSTLLRANGSRMSLRNPLKVATTLLAGLERLQALGPLPFGRSVSFGGRLIAGRRAPLEGASVRIVERFGAGAEPRERVSTVRTGSGGAFGFRLRPGPSREVVAVFPGGPALRASSSQATRLEMRGSLRMRASSRLATIGGRPVVFRGAVEGPIPPDGKLVQLQFRLPGLPWAEFRSLRTDPLGRFRYAYRFADDDSRGVRFQIRAFAPPQAGWPYEPAGSQPVEIRGR